MNFPIQRDIYQEQINARNEQFRLAELAAARGDSVKSSEYIRIGNMCDDAAQMIITNTYQ